MLDSDRFSVFYKRKLKTSICNLIAVAVIENCIVAAATKTVRS